MSLVSLNGLLHQHFKLFIDGATVGSRDGFELIHQGTVNAEGIGIGLRHGNTPPYGRYRYRIKKIYFEQVFKKISKRY